MRGKSTIDRYGTVAISFHWLAALLILMLYVTGFQASTALDTAGKAVALRVHITIAIIALVLTLSRLLWWWRFDRKPQPLPGTARWQVRVANTAHVALYVVTLGMFASGIGMIVLSGAWPLVMGEPAMLLPDFSEYQPRRPHGAGALLLLTLTSGHVFAALYHQWCRGKKSLARMWFGANRARLDQPGGRDP